MAQNPQAIEDKLNAAIDGWTEHAADASFSDLTLAQFKAKVKPSLDARETIRQLEQQLDAARVARENADVDSLETAQQVVNSVKGDPNHGENSPLYASFGYIRKNDRKSGLTRPAPVALPKAA